MTFSPFTTIAVRLLRTGYLVKKNLGRFGLKRALRVENRFVSGAKKIVSFSLYGSDARYFAELDTLVSSYKKYLPDYTCRFHLASDVELETVDRLKCLGAEIVTMAATGVNPTFMFWRFLPAEDLTLDSVLVRDVDTACSRLEEDLVRDWEASEFQFHIIRSHPSHNAPIMGGLWGIRPGAVRLSKYLSRVWLLKNQYGRDQMFLGRWIYPKIVDRALIHDVLPGFASEPNVVELPIDEENFSFVGEPPVPGPDQEGARESFRLFHLEQSQRGSKPDHRRTSYWR